MTDVTNDAFISLFKAACIKCYGVALSAPLSETESKHFSNKILEETGLVIGAKSIKNYSIYILGKADAKPENPSIATLDTLARYVLQAPYISETDRKNNQSHYPFWFQYRNQFAAEMGNSPEKSSSEHVKNVSGNQPVSKKKKSINVYLIVVAVAIIIAIVAVFFFTKTGAGPEQFADNFKNVQEDSLASRGWFVQNRDEKWWERRGEYPAHLMLFTLRGDNWADSANAPAIKNLLLRKVSSDCFTTEIHLDNFMPLKRWQQAGILLLEDTTSSSRSLRLSLAYNDFFGGFDKPSEIIIQAISSQGNEANHPEEILHYPAFSLAEEKDSIVRSNLQKSALKIEKTGNHFRFLYATGEVENFAFKELLSKELPIQPKYVAIFALQGFVKDTHYIPAYFKFFSLFSSPCEK